MICIQLLELNPGRNQRIPGLQTLLRKVVVEVAEEVPAARPPQIVVLAAAVPERLSRHFQFQLKCCAIASLSMLAVAEQVANPSR